VRRPRDELVEGLHVASGDVLPEEHRPGHVHVSGVVAVQQVVDLVREVLIARDDPDVEVDAGALLELARMPLDAGDIGVGVWPEEADGGHRANVTPTRYARRRWSATRSTPSWTPAGAPGSRASGPTSPGGGARSRPSPSASASARSSPS